MEPAREPPQRRRAGGAFSLTSGGPFHELLTRLRLRTPSSMVRCWWLGLLAWIPLVVGEGVRVALGAPGDPILRDLSLHTRFLVALPVLLSSEVLLEQTARSAIHSFDVGRFCDHAIVDRICERAERLRASWQVELALLVIALLGGQLVLWDVFGTTGLFHGGATAGFLSFSRVWYAVFALPLLQFVMFRWLWRWLIWTYVLACIARERLDLLATHADSACGLAALARPISAFSAFVLAIGAILSGAWATRMIADQTTLGALWPNVVTFLVAALVVAAGPLVLLSGHLFRARRRTLAQYGDFMRDYTVRFHRKWVAGDPDAGERVLGTADIQSLSDLGQAFQVASKSRVFVFSMRNVVVVWAAGLVPMLPLVMSTLTFEQVLKRIVSTVLVGIPI